MKDNCAVGRNEFGKLEADVQGHGDRSAAADHFCHLKLFTRLDSTYEPAAVEFSEHEEEEQAGKPVWRDELIAYNRVRNSGIGDAVRLVEGLARVAGRQRLGGRSVSVHVIFSHTRHRMDPQEMRIFSVPQHNVEVLFIKAM